ncbi:hypothetical protein [Ethanoligenens harbinense]|uniref:hypothetical protein n=1 Tax=Ethanoligenens harbinense TaxID=253239 RepID=UPI0010C0ED40|nr:hypothetical protein [Ethanoligenens harbinense]
MLAVDFSFTARLLLRKQRRMQPYLQTQPQPLPPSGRSERDFSENERLSRLQALLQKTRRLILCIKTRFTCFACKIADWQSLHKGRMAVD